MVAGPLGSFVVWRRLSYFSDSIAHASLLGIVLGYIFHLNSLVTVIATTLLFAYLLASIKLFQTTDTILNIMTNTFLSLGMVLLYLFPNNTKLAQTQNMLFGDILRISNADLLLLGITSVILLGIVIYRWRNWLLVTINTDLAHVEGINIKASRIEFTLTLAAFTALAMHVVGTLIIVALLVIAAATGRIFAKNPMYMVIYASLFNIATMTIGFIFALKYHLPAGPTVVICAVLLFIVSNLINWSYFQR